MQTLCIDGTWKKKIILNKQILDYIKKNKMRTVALFASVQFLQLDEVKHQLNEIGIKTITTKAKRTHVEGQILGCDAYHDSFEKDILAQSDCIMYVGDGMFHPKALLLAQIYTKKILPVIIWDPVVEQMKVLGYDDIKDQIRQTRANLKKFVNAKTVGILVTVKPGQQYLGAAKRLKAKLSAEGKTCYIFLDDDIQLNLLENYPFCQAWVNTACPRIGTDDITTINKPLINIREALDPIGCLERLFE